MYKPKHAKDSTNDNAKDQIGDENIVVSSEKKNSKTEYK